MLQQLKELKQSAIEDVRSFINGYLDACGVTNPQFYLNELKQENQVTQIDFYNKVLDQYLNQKNSEWTIIKYNPYDVTLCLVNNLNYNDVLKLKISHYYERLSSRLYMIEY